jgi:hypothetical protein
MNYSFGMIKFPLFNLSLSFSKLVVLSLTLQALRNQSIMIAEINKLVNTFNITANLSINDLDGVKGIPVVFRVSFYFLDTNRVSSKLL